MNVVGACGGRMGASVLGTLVAVASLAGCTLPEPSGDRVVIFAVNRCEVPLFAAVGESKWDLPGAVISAEDPLQPGVRAQDYTSVDMSVADGIVWVWVASVGDSRYPVDPWPIDVEDLVAIDARGAFAARVDGDMCPPGEVTKSVTVQT